MPHFMIDLTHEGVDGVGHEGRGGQFDDDPFGYSGPGLGVGMVFGGDVGVG